jgi:glutamyl-tRNA reductase
VKEAYRIASENDACGTITHSLFQSAVRASQRVRTETRLAEGRVSIASVAVGDFAKNIFDSFIDKRVVVLGAGEMAEETLRYLQSAGVENIVVLNRSLERAQRLASEFRGTAAPWTELEDWLGRADVIVSTTGADRPIVTRPQLERLRTSVQRRRTLFILDLGAPRDFSPDVGELDDVFLYDIDALTRTCEANRKARVREIDRARRILAEETDRFFAEFHRRAGSDIVVRLREGWHETSRSELQRLFQKRPGLSEEDRTEIERSVERIVNKLLHPPLETLRDESKTGTPHNLLEALTRLFRLS